MYLGFSSNDLDQNQITDYLTRVVQPKLSAITGVQRADILGEPHVRDARVAQARADGGARHRAVRRSATRSRANNYLSAVGQTKGSMVSVNLVANTDLQTVEEFKQLVVKQKDGVVVRLGDIADVVLGAENYDSGRPVQRRDGDVHGHLGAADRQLARRHQARCAPRSPDIRRSCRPA